MVMPDLDDLRREIAERLGWQVYHYDKGRPAYYLLVDENFDALGKERNTEEEAWADAPDWPRDLNAAMGLVPEIYRLKLVVWPIDNAGPRCYAEIEYVWTGGGDTPAEAVCRAVEAWKAAQAGVEGG